MADPALEVILQGLGDPLTDGLVLDPSLTSDPTNQTSGQFDREHFLDFGNRQRAGLLLGGPYVASRLASGDTQPSGQKRDNLCRSLCLVQKLNGLVHASVILSYGRAVQYATNILPYTSMSRVHYNSEVDREGVKRASAGEANSPKTENYPLCGRRNRCPLRSTNFLVGDSVPLHHAHVQPHPDQSQDGPVVDALLEDGS
jgi:hypothetical protein